MMAPSFDVSATALVVFVFLLTGISHGIAPADSDRTANQRAAGSGITGGPTPGGPFRDVSNASSTAGDTALNSQSVEDTTERRDMAQEAAAASEEGAFSSDAIFAAQTAADVDSPTSAVQCDVISHAGCRVQELERCSPQGRCTCLNGYVRRSDTGLCVAAQFYQGKIAFMDTFSEQLREVSEGVRQLVFSSLVNEGARGVLDVYVTSVRRSAQPPAVTSEWELAMASSANPTREGLMRAYNKGLVDLTYVDVRDEMIKIVSANVSFVLGRNGTSLASFLEPFVEFSHCVDKNHNYCDVNADCSNSLGTVRCTCRQNFDDVSLDVTRAPGEKCAESCSCRNNGTCKRDGSGNTNCVCPTWYLGNRCEVNGKEVLIICCSVVGGLLLIAAVLCVVCACIAKRSRKSSRDSTVGVGSLDTSVVKLPRVWMDGTARPYDLPPRDTRRWSYVSEPVRYVDEYVMDDYVHAGTLPLPRSHDAKKKYYAAYPVGTLNHGYSSSTLSARPYPRH